MARYSSNKILVPEARQGLNNFKMEVANQLGLTNYDSMDKGNLTSRENGSVGGEMVKRMVEAYQRNL
ncbi:alpha/beta-type small acid-soluble spore protein [Clostridium cochlearium]|uniref:Alpha/beta-type small acid-soluble spore protein n=1 Tax=Clostridium cochlearium TaxID=1494 RepID=A0A240A035_CLOCO|nr:alpha/beta-type small acid-soluble spore protein [Clostridium cochlearium]MBV1821904.1 alpha/beta-type small acid-soluble spore protein [Bacteroidales bacterium MSK.15.36]NSJ91092.1 alpha/beta-type small acid-soluble spore protein [Coprococcus sp. MSK.21.13]MBE6064413.1 alpha/beta-type small acid-soluble spore protein [Clostridium cochlearium]MBU5268860.1 alpha/beta-type small acid-soluble spore protein [Clostridium cochlearium]MCG4570932.1 alpha/beta-type small acid-soluble spore protein [